MQIATKQQLISILRQIFKVTGQVLNRLDNDWGICTLRTKNPADLPVERGYVEVGRSVKCA